VGDDVGSGERGPEDSSFALASVLTVMASNPPKSGALMQVNVRLWGAQRLARSPLADSKVLP
jgi:hypothetical protein